MRWAEADIWKCNLSSQQVVIEWNFLGPVDCLPFYLFQIKRVAMLHAAMSAIRLNVKTKQSREEMEFLNYSI